MRENASRSNSLTCRLKAVRLVVSMCGVLFAGAMAANAATDFSDYSVFASASSTQVSSIKIGATTDTESAITANTTATGDDTTGSDDEDGVTLPSSVTLGASSSMTVNVTNTSGATVYLNVWIDFNRNGVLTDSGEQVAVNTTIATGTSASNRTVNFTVPATASVGTAGVRVRLTSTSTPSSTGLVGNGEVEDYVMTLACPTLSLSPGATGIPDAYVGTAFSQTITASGGNGSYTYAVTSGSLPSGLSLSSAGVISGTPTGSNGSGSSVTIRATDGNGCQVSLAYNVQVCPTISLSPTTLSSSMVGVSYSQTITASGGASAYTYAVSSGTLPAGLSLNTGTGVISGTPTSTSSATFTIGVTDANGCVATRSYTTAPAASTDYGDYSGFGSVSSTTNSNLRIGATTDVEDSATTNSTATGDDSTGSDDEDGVTIPASLMLSNASSITVNVTNTTGATAYLNVWIDYNQNGVLTDSGEQIATNTVIATGTSNSNKTVNFTVPNTATTGTTGVRVRLTSTSSPGSTGTSGNGEVEDYTVVLAPSLGIGNLIWNDANENGLYDVGESGIDNVLVELWTPGADNAVGGTGSNLDTKVASMTTSGGGVYGFSGLTAGYYFVKVPTPPLSRTSLVYDSTDNGQDGDNNATQPGGSSTSAYSPVIQLAVGVEPGTSGTGNVDNTVDFGFAANIGSPFVCDNRFWIVQNAETTAGSGVYDATLYYVGDGPSLVPTFFFSGYKLNGLAAYGGYLYCVDQNGNHLYRINSQGVLVDMGAIPGLPEPGTGGQWSGATALTNGRMILNLYNFSPASTQLYTIDLSSASLIGSPVTVTNTGTGTTYGGNFGDIVWDPLTGKVYGYSTVDTSWLGLFEINITTGAATRVSTAVPGAWGSMIIDANGLTYGFGSAGATGSQDTLYVFNRTSGVLNGSITAVGTGPAVSNSDGAACPGAAPSMKLGNQVWNDLDNDGIKEAGESGIDGVTLQLFLGGQNPLTAAPAATTTTAGGGFYSFNNLSPGQYFIYMPTPPAGFPLSSTTTATTDNNVDNDDNGIQTSQGQPVQSPLIGLAGGTESITDGDTDSNTNLSIDFGFLACAATTVSPTTPAAMTFGTAYTQTFTATGGISPYTWSVSSGTLPAGLSLNTSTGVVSGTPTSGATASFTLTATGTGGCTGTRSYTITPACTTVSVTTSTLPDAFLGTAYSQTLAATGGTTPYTWAVSSGTLPAGLSLSSTGVISGTATAANGAGVSVTFTATDAKSCVGTKTLLVQTCPVVTVNPTTLPVPTVGTAYSQTISTSGGTGATVLAVASGSLPTGLSFNTSTGVISGTPANTTSATFTISGTDSNGCVGTRSFTLAPVCPTVTISPSTLSDAAIGTAYSQTLSASGGTASYTWAVTSGTLPTGLSLNASTGVISGTPTTSNGAGVSLTFRATDAYGCQGTLTATLQVCPVLSMSPATLTTAVQGSAYSQTLTATGGTASYVYSLASGTLPSGLSLSSAGVISGTPTASNGTGTSLTILVTDANGCQASFIRNLQVCPVITLTPSTLPAPTVGTAYSQSISASGGAASYTYTLASGTLPTWATLSAGGVLSGTPTSTTAATFTVRATDANGCTGTLSYTVTPVCPTITIAQSSLPQGTVGTAYSQTLSASGGTAPYSSWTITSGTLPTGLSLNASTGVISGTPTASASPATTITVRANDTYGCQGSRAITLQICPIVTLSPATPATGTVGTAYSQTFTASGGAASYTWAVASGTLPAGLSLNASTGVVSGTPTAQISSNVTLRATDANACQGTLAVTFAISCPVITVNPSTLPQGTVGSAYSQTITASGGSSSYVFAITSGTLPAGLTLNASTGVISGTPTTSNAAGTSITISATDSFNCSGTKTYTLQVCPVVTVSPATLPTPTVGTAYSQTLSASGGAASYTYTIAGGALPAWATLSSSGVLSGTPTSTTSATFTVKATDANGCPGTLSYTITPVCPTITITQSSLAQGTVGTAYSQTLSATGGTAPYSAWTLTSGSLPSGLTLTASTGVISGTPSAPASPSTTLTFRVNDAYGCQGTRSITLQICPVVTLSPTTLPTPTVGTAYSQTITSSGGASSYTYTVSSGALPAWATLSSSGVLSGTPTSTASATFTVQSVDANGCAGTRSYTVTPVCPTITVTPATLADGLVGTAYSQTVSSSGGIAPYTFAVTSGTLPAGLALNSSSGVISGTPTAANGLGVNVTIRATDANGCQGSQVIVLQICPVITLAPASLPTPTVGTAYSQTITSSGGTSPYTYALASGSLPAWATLTSAGVLSGTPNNTTAASFTLRSTDANGCTGTLAYTLTPVCPTITITQSSLPQGTVGTSYSQTLSASGGISPYSTWTVTSGALPAGLSLSTSSGTISGTPTASASPSTTFTVRVNDANGCQGSRAITLQICPIVALSPSTPATSTVGTTYSQTVTASGGTAAYVFALTSGSLPAGLSLNTSTGVISGTPTTPTAATCTISATDANGCAGSISYTITPAPNTDFGDFSTFASVSNTNNGTLKIGLSIDAEVTGTSNASATGDDTTGSDDEDGVTVPGSITAGAPVTIPVTVTNSGSTTAYLNAWIDFNNNGVLTDSGEQIAIDTPVAAGTSAGTVSVSFTVPVGASVGASRGVRVRLTGTATPGSTGTGGVGEIEDYIVTIAAPTIDFGDHSAFASAGSTLLSTLKIGSLTDVEGQSTMNATATGDDITGSDDEDGVTVPSTITQGVASSLTVNVTNTSGASAYLNAWIDFNGNGVLTDSGEQIATNTAIATGTSNSNKTVSFTVPATVKVGTVGVRVRLTSTSSPGSTGTVGSGEVEDYTTSIVATSDFGDYASFGSASSKSNNTLKLGLLVDAEGSDVLNTTATGDDLDGSDDEDGVTVPASIAQGAAGSLTVNVTNTSGSTGYLNAWIDFNRNGVLTDSGEQVATNTAITTGTSNVAQTINFTAPVGASLGTAGVRVRFSSTSSPGSTGLSGNGEVEDWVTSIVVPTTDFGDYSGFADAFSTVNSNLQLGALTDAEGSATRNATATGDDSTGSDDEDSVVFPSMTAGQPGSVSVVVTNTSGAPAYLNAWIDFNNNGSLLDAGEQIATDIVIADGTDGENQVVNFTVPTNAVTAATSLGTRLRLTSVATPGPTGGAGIGEVEDHTIVILAPLTDFGDFSGTPDVSNTASTNLRLGTLVDTEYSSTRNATATGDDVVGSDDEDGVTLPSMTAGAPATIPVVVTNNSGSVGYLNAWIDYNNNGVFTDSGEQIASNVSIVTGTSNATQNINITVPAAAQTGTNLGARFRISTDVSPGSTGSGGVGEVEDYVVNIAAATTDFGDFASFGSASSLRNSTIKLGLITDTEYVQTTNATATGDDITGQADEDAVTFPALTAGAPVTIPVLVTNTSGATVYLNAWIDYNNNGVVTDSGEQIATNVAVATGASNVAQNLNVTIPANVLTGVNLGARFRLTSTSGALSTGAVGNGEVEDYIVNISAPTTDFGDFSGFADASQGANPSLHIGTLIDTEFASTRNATATGDDTTGTDDEDGVVVPSMIAGQTVTIPVTITNTTGATGYLNAWIDFNNNGLLTDSGEQIATNLTINNGTTNGVTNLSVIVPANAVTGSNLGLRFRLSAPSGLGPTGANGLAGEIEDYVVNISAPTTDFGDYSGFGSASSTQISTLKVGALTDTEYAQTTNGTATGDDVTGVDDEDGVTLPTLTAGGPATIPVTVTNTSGATAFLNAWIDYNNNGVLTDAGEQIASNTVIANGTSNAVQNLNITVPAGATVGTNLGVRVRLTSTSTPGSTGLSGNGEVEDYLVNIASPTTDFGDFSGFSSASNAAGNSLRLGALVDTEYTGTSNASATGDDTTGLADEDGVTLPAMTAGQTLNIPVVVTNTTGSAAFLNAWIDFNNNGVPTDSGEQVVTNLSVATGSNGVTLNPSITVPAGAVTGTALGVRFRLTAVSTPGVSGALASLGEVEDYTVTVLQPTTDFGDNSTLAGASSTANSSLRLGALTDVEYVATMNLTATGDDNTGVDDEDGVTLPTLTAGAPATIPVIVTNTSGAAAFLNVWIDYNNNAVLTDSGEQIATNVSIPTGTTNSTQNLNITVPAAALTNTNLAVRVRLTSVSSPGTSGAAGMGEVEDYIVSIATPPLDYGDWNGVADAASNASNSLRLGALVDTEYASTRNISATGDDITGVDDEDGVTLPSMTAGAPATIPVTVTNTSGASAYLNVWIDYNNNGVLTDSGEQIATNLVIANGTSNSTQNISITIPANAVTGSNVGVRVRLTDVASPGVTGTVGNGEVEDYVTPIAVPTTDFGDWSGAADASSIASSNLRMGALADTEYVSTLNATATGDDTTASDDEDGVTLASQTPGTAGSATVVVTNNSGAAGYLNAWIDFNNNGSFADAGEQIATNTSIANGTNGVTQTVNFIVPVGAVPGQRGARFRLTSTQNPTSVGASGVGEVEDYLVTITCLPIAVTPSTLATPTVGTAYSQTVTSTGGLAPYTFSVGSGSLPAGLTLSSGGVISGTATSSSAATFSIVATDSYGCTGSTSYTVTPVCPTITVNPSTLPSGLVGTAYSQTLTASGGTAGYTFAVSSGTLPAGLTLNASSGVISGTPTTSNASGVSLTFRATDANGCSGTRTLTFIICPVITLTPATLPAPTVGTPYSQSITASGSAAAYTYSVASGALPAWATLSSAGVLSGTPTNTNSATFTVKATDANGCTGTLSYTLSPVCPTVTITPATLAQGTVGTAYSQALSATGGIAPYSSWTLTAGTLPAGLSLNASTGVISGTPTAVVSPATTITVRVNDANGCQGSRTVSLQICPVITLSPATLPTPVVGTAYSQSLSAANGTSPYTFTLANGALPAWATLSSAGVLSGTPTTTTAAAFSVRATDANGCSGTQSYTVTPVCPAISLAPTTPAQGIVGSAYSQALTPSGGTAPYSAFTVTSGTLPAGLSLDASTGVISGTPTTTNGTGVSVSIRVTDTYGCQGTQAILLQVCPVITLAPTTPVTPTVSTAYSQTFTASGSTGSYTFSVASGALPTWATLSSSGILSGMPDSPNSATFTLKATDANGCSGTQSYTITPACPTLTITPTTAAPGTVGSNYSQTLSGNGGTGPYGSWTVISGTLPAGLSLSAAGVISGTPTASNGAGVSFTVRTTDARGCSATGVISLKVCPVVSVSPTTLAASTAGSSYSQTISGSGSTGAYVFAVTSGALPTGLTLNSSTGVISGTPTSTSATNFTISATDANGCAGTRSYTLTPACQTITVGPATLTNGAVNSAYSQTVTSTSGIGTVTFAISSGSLPAGLSLNGSTGVISGTPTSTAAASFTVRATDANGCTGSTAYTVTPACPTITVGPGTLTTGNVGVAYAQTLSGAGGIAPYSTWTVISGTLPAGLSLNASSGVISGTPTTSNGTGVNVTIRTTDANGCTGSSVVSLKICPVITQSPATLATPTVGVAYTQAITAAGGVSPYTYTIASGALPAGMTLSSSGTLSGTTPSSSTATFSVKATAADGCSGTASYTLTPVCPTLAISPNGTLSPAYLGAPYTQTLTGSGGTGPYTFALQSGDLPSGVLLASNGTLNGTPTAKGVFPVTWDPLESTCRHASLSIL